MSATLKGTVRKFLWDHSAFRCCYFLSLFLSSLCFVELGFQILTGVTMVWSVLILIDIFRRLYPRKNLKYFELLCAFVACGLATALLHAEDNLVTNLVMMYHVAVCFFIVYGMHAERDKEKVRREMFFMAKILAFLITIFAVAGLLAAFLFTRVRAFSYCIGLMDNRFTGLYTNPNIAAYVSVVGLVCIHLIYGKSRDGAEKRKLPRWFLNLGIAVNVLTVLLSDSNASMVFLLVYGTAFLFTRMYRKNGFSKGKILVKKTVLILLVALTASIGCFTLREVSQYGMAQAINALHKSGTTVVTSDAATSASEVLVTIGRDGNYELSSGRLDSLQKAMVLYQKNPIMGIGKGNILEYGNRYLARGFQFFDLHNGYLTILISCGTVGLGLFLAFAVLAARKVMKAVFRRYSQRGERELVILFCSLCAYAVYALFERALLFDITFMVVSFWMLFGYTMNETLIEEPFLCPVTVRSRVKKAKEPVGALPALTRRTGNDII